jgi:N-acetylglucosaminyldiphosphoundecaprenol N-acetyl-beta-D-mannosaminyltransferase
MENYFNIRYEFDKRAVLQAIDEALLLGKPGYICVSDGVILSTVNRDPDYRQVVDGAMFSICDSGYVPLYLRWIYGIERHQYCGSEIFMDIVHMKRYKMAFLGTTQATLNGLQNNLSEIDPRIANMWFYSLPYKRVEEFDYPAIAEMLNHNGAFVLVANVETCGMVYPMVPAGGSDIYEQIETLFETRGDDRCGSGIQIL